MDARFRYGNNAKDVRLPMLLPGTVTAYQGRRALVVDVEERVLDDGRWVVRLDLGDGGKQVALGGSAQAVMPVFREPYQVCSCHGQPWPCDDAYAAKVREREEWMQRDREAHQCASCGQERNLGPLRHGKYPEIRRYCRRVGCVREAERWTRELHNDRVRENNDRQAFAEQMRDALASDTGSTESI